MLCLRSRWETFSEAFRESAAGNVARVDVLVDGDTRRYHQSFFVFGAALRMVETMLLRPILFADATYSKIKFWLTGPSALSDVVRAS